MPKPHAMKTLAALEVFATCDLFMCHFVKLRGHCSRIYDTCFQTLPKIDARALFAYFFKSFDNKDKVPEKLARP